MSPGPEDPNIGKSQFVIVNAEGALWVLPPTDDHKSLATAATMLGKAYPDLTFRVNEIRAEPPQQRTPIIEDRREP